MVVLLDEERTRRRRGEWAMRGGDDTQGAMLSYVSLEDRVPADHPLRVVRRLVDSALQALSPRFAAMYSDVGRPSIAPERLLRALLLQAFYTARSERQLVEQLNYTCCFAGLTGWASMARSGTPRRFRRTASAFSSRTSPPSFSPPCSGRRGRKGCCRPSSLPSTAR
jgi:hypothetical protein